MKNKLNFRYIHRCLQKRRLNSNHKLEHSQRYPSNFIINYDTQCTTFFKFFKIMNDFNKTFFEFKLQIRIPNISYI